MLKNNGLIKTTIPFLIFFGACNPIAKKSIDANKLFQFDETVEPRWSSAENMNGLKGAGGIENNSAKGHAWDAIPAGASYALLDIKAQGIINRIWVTMSDRSPEMLRSLKIEMFWNGEATPAVSVPFGDFFGIPDGKTTAFQNALFTTGEGRSFCSFIQMPFKTKAKIVITNESTKPVDMLFFDVDYSLLKNWDESYLYFHACWNRDTATQLAKDFELLPKINGKGRFLGLNIGVNGNPVYKKSWFGEGEVKIYLDGDTDYPTLNGTGTEDYIATAWGQGRFINTYNGCSNADDSLLQWAFYRFHIPDPIFFSKDCRITLQQMGGDFGSVVAAYQRKNIPLIPVTLNNDSLQLLYHKGVVTQLSDSLQKNSWANFYRSDDVSATVYFYLDKPVNTLPPLASVRHRAANLRYAL